MLGRQIRSRLDLLIPHNPKVEENPGLTKRFYSNDHVTVRDYLSNGKWKFGTVEKKTEAVGNVT